MLVLSTVARLWLPPAGRTRSRARSAARRVLVCAIVVGLYAGCVSNDEGTAVARVEAYLRAASDQADDRGWSQLVASQRASSFRDRASYIAAAAASEWNTFDWEVVEAMCDDGVCTVWLKVPSRRAIPNVLGQGIVEWRETGVPDGANASVTVLQRGILGEGIAVSQG